MSAQLGLPNLGGVFIVLAGGMIFSVLLAIMEFMWEKRKMIQDPMQSIWVECFKEIRMALDIRIGSTRPVQKEESSNSSSSSSSESSSSEDIYGLSNLPHDEQKGANFSKNLKADSAYSVYKMSQMDKKQ